MSRCAIISGGGNRGAYFAGWLTVTRPEYSMVYGNSAGANMAIPVAVGEYDELAAAYGSLSNDIWKRNPLNRKGKLSYWKAFWGLVLHNGFGDLSNLLPLLEQGIGEPIWQKLEDQGKRVVVAVTNLQSEPIELMLYDSKKYGRQDMINAIYASSCFWPMCRPAFGVWADGGHLETLLIDQAINDGFAPEDIDVYVCRVHPMTVYGKIAKNFFQTAKRLVLGSRHAIVYEDLFRAIHYGKVLEQNVHWLPYEPAGNAMDFNTAKVAALVEQGKKDAKIR